MSKVGLLRFGLSRTRLAVAAVVVVALVLRLAAIEADGGYTPLNDSLDYDRHARSLAESGTYPEALRSIAPGGGPTAFRPPTYPLFLASVYEVTGESVEAGRYANALLGALAVLLAFAVARELFSRRIALVAAAITAVYPPLVALSLELYSEPLFIVFLLGSALAALRYRRDPRLPLALLAGGLAGLATLTRPNGVLLIPFLAWALWATPRRARRSWLAPVAATLAALIVIAPWTVRNQIVLNTFVPIATGTGFNLAGVYNDEARTDPRFAALWRLPSRVDTYANIYGLPNQREVDIDDLLTERAVDYAVAQPVYVAEVLLWSGLRTLNLADAGTATDEGIYSARGVGVEISKLEPIGFFTVAALALAGAVAMMRRPRGQRGLAPLWLLGAALVASTLPVIGLPRYRAPAEPLLIIVAAVGAVAISDRVRGAHRRKAAGG